MSSNKVTHRSSKADMLKYAAEELGVKLDESKERADIWAEIKDIDKSLAEGSEATPTGEENLPEKDSTQTTGSTKTTDTTKSDDDIVNKNSSDKKADDKPTRPKRVLINLHQPSGSDDPEFEPDTHVVVGVNGRNYQLEIGKDLPVPYSVYDVLRNAKQKKYYRSKNQQTGETETKSKTVLRHPFSVIKEL